MKWNKNGVFIASDKKQQITTENNSTVLNISSVNKLDEGSYGVELNDSVETLKFKTDLIVKGKILFDFFIVSQTNYRIKML